MPNNAGDKKQNMANTEVRYKRHLTLITTGTLQEMTLNGTFDVFISSFTVCATLKNNKGMKRSSGSGCTWSSEPRRKQSSRRWLAAEQRKPRAAGWGRTE